MNKTKKFLIGLLALSCIATTATACNGFYLGSMLNSDSTQSSGEFGVENGVYTLETVYAKAQELGYKGTLEEFKEQIKGNNGKDGEKGDKGDKGENGEKGDKGDKGDDGVDGIGIIDIKINGAGKLEITLSDNTKIDLGKIVGTDGKDGVDGKSAYELYCETYPEYTGTLEDWLASLKGEVGKDGQDGKDGAGGKDGQDGKDGVDGAKGDKGDKGDDGVGIEKVEYDENGNLVITFTDGTKTTVEMPEKEVHTTNGAMVQS